MCKTYVDILDLSKPLRLPSMYPFCFGDRLLLCVKNSSDLDFVRTYCLYTVQYVYCLG
jgi:hypothetical protein